MSILPDEIWYRILEIGTETLRLSYRDLCCLSISCRRFNRLSLDPTLWARLLSHDFPSPDQPYTPSKSLYKTKFERDKARRIAAWRRKILIAESHVSMCKQKLADLKSIVIRENKRLKQVTEEIVNSERARSASVALNVWQPEVIRGRQKQIVEQCTVSTESRATALNMELRVCKQQISTYNKAYNKEKERLREYEAAVNSLKYNPMQKGQLDSEINEVKVKRKNLKHSECPETSSN